MIAPVLPIGRDDGYYRVDRGLVLFVPMRSTPMVVTRAAARIIEFPRRDRAIARAVGAMVEAAIDTPAEKIRFVSRRADQLDVILDEIDGYRGEE